MRTAPPAVCGQLERLNGALRGHAPLTAGRTRAGGSGGATRRGGHAAHGEAARGLRLRLRLAARRRLGGRRAVHRHALALGLAAQAAAQWRCRHARRGRGSSRGGETAVHHVPRLALAVAHGGALVRAAIQPAPLRAAHAVERPGRRRQQRAAAWRGRPAPAALRPRDAPRVLAALPRLGERAAWRRAAARPGA